MNKRASWSAVFAASAFAHVGVMWSGGFSILSWLASLPFLGACVLAFGFLYAGGTGVETPTQEQPARREEL